MPNLKGVAVHKLTTVSAKAAQYHLFQEPHTADDEPDHADVPDRQRAEIDDIPPR